MTEAEEIASDVARWSRGYPPVVHWITNVMMATNAALGVAVLVGGVRRFAIPTYQPLIDLTAGHTWLWSVWIAASAALMMIPHRRPQIVGLWLGMVWHIFWAALFSVAVARYPGAAATPAIAYGGFAMICAALLVARIIRQPER